MSRASSTLIVVLAFCFLAGCERQILLQQAGPADRFSNPVIPGFAPDPSIVRVGSDFYVVNSTFEYFPGIPIYHSRDLVNWELIAYALHDRSQVNLDHVASGSGIHASTIRYHDGVFYIVTTNNIDGTLVNFIVTATDPRGPWSAAHVLAGAPGIDPSLFFDDDGRVWYVGNDAPTDPQFAGQMEIWLHEIDIDAMALTGERHFLWRGCCQGAWAEGPHIYKREGYYYLLISEGGTAYEHALSVAISRSITGPYQNNPRNPILSHRQLSYYHPITGVGHADFVELADGRWYAVALGWRLIDGRHGLTFPVVSPRDGRVALHDSLPFAGTVQHAVAGFDDGFDAGQLGLEWNFRRTPTAAFHSLTANPGSLRLDLQPGQIAEHGQYSFVGVRQRHFRFDAVTKMTLTPAGPNEEAGLSVIQNDRSAFLMTLTRGDAGNELRLYQTLQGKITPIARHAYADGTFYLGVSGDYLDYDFRFSANGQNWQVLADNVDGTSLSPAVIGGFNYTGVYIGLYATSNDLPTGNHADYDYFRYTPASDNRDHWYHRQRDRELDLRCC